MTDIREKPDFHHVQLMLSFYLFALVFHLGLLSLPMNNIGTSEVQCQDDHAEIESKRPWRLPKWWSNVNIDKNILTSPCIGVI